MSQPRTEHTAVSVDPVTLEVVRSALIGIAEEAGAALRRTASSPNIKERADCSTAVFDAHGRMVAQAEHIPVHLGSMPLSVAAARSHHDHLGVGDQVLVSDPYAGGTHLPDWTLVAPVHTEPGPDGSDAVLLGYVATRAHHADVGGAAPGSMPTGAVDIVAEGLRIPPVRLQVAGRTQPDLLALLLANTRTPEERRGDLEAQLGANALAARRLRELAATRGVDGLAAAMAATLDHAERSIAAALTQLPEGTATAEDVLDDDGAGTTDIRIRATVTLADGRVTMDLTGSDPQVPGNVNAPLAVTLSAAVYALRAVVAPDLPANDGLRRVLELVTTPGTIVDARAPAAVAGGNVETSQCVVDAVFGALGVVAASQGTMNNLSFGNAQHQYYETLCGGAGAGPGHDGASAVHTHMTNSRLTDPEILEMRHPVRVESFAVRRGSGGAGRHRGGDGVVRRLRFDQAVSVALISNRRRVPPFGLEGGSAGAPGRNRLIRADGTQVPLAGITEVQLEAGDLLEIATPGGGGFGEE